jgi:hypothetical protein
VVLFLLALSLTMQAEAKAGFAQALALRDLQNFTYDFGANSNVEGGKVPLANGKWSDRESGSTFTLHATHALGDLDGDGSGDGIAILVETSSGTGSFYYMFAIAARGGKPVQLGEPEWLGDRTVVQRLTIERKGVISIRYITHADGDPSCCPTMKIEDRYRVENGRLVGITK